MGTPGRMMLMKNRITPIVCAEYNEDSDAYDVEIQLPGA